MTRKHEWGTLRLDDLSRPCGECGCYTTLNVTLRVEDSQANIPQWLEEQCEEEDVLPVGCCTTFEVPSCLRGCIERLQSIDHPAWESAASKVGAIQYWPLDED